MKKLITLLTISLIATTAFAQAPQKMSYQSVIRDANDNLATETNVGIQISILQYNPEGSVVYVETHSAMTNVNGLVSLELGMGTPAAGLFSDIDWGDGPYFILTETDPEGGTNYTLSGVSELLSVPYALYSNQAGSAAFTTNNNVTSNAVGDDYPNNAFVFGSPSLEYNGIPLNASRMCFIKSKAAFRVGFNSNDGWDEANVGTYSLAAGINSKAIGFGAIALGSNNSAVDEHSVAIGRENVSNGHTSIAIGGFCEATGDFSTSLGRSNVASGIESTALGAHTIAPSRNETAIGSYNTEYSPFGLELSSWHPQDRLFVIGNGSSEGTRSDAMVVLKNGNVGIGTSTPNELLEVAGDGRAFFGDGGGGNRKGLLIDGTWLSTATRIESYNYTNGQGLDLVFNDIGNGDVGIKVSNPNVSLDVSGSIEYTGTITDVSDERLKENFETIENPLESISQIQGYSYNMKNDEAQVREYGVIAQEIQKVFPELVTVVDQENGYLGVSYVQLIPILLEAVKEQQGVISEQQIIISEMRVENNRMQAVNSNQSKFIAENTRLLQELNNILKTQTNHTTKTLSQ